ncbi:hypothetical protein RJ639_035076, partial [Escallonia herrerae]
MATPDTTSPHVSLQDCHAGGAPRHLAAASDGGGSSTSSSSSGRASSVSGIEIVGVSDKERGRGRGSSVSECSVDVDLEAGVHSGNAHLAKPERDCRICHLSLDVSNQESGVPIELGCSCKADLAAAHKQCAEAWFKIKGNKICEICGSIARNVAGASEAELMEQWNEANDAASATAAAPVNPAETRNFWQGHRFLNFLLACM